MATTAKQARHSHFQRGQGSFCCRNCGRKTRDTGDNGQLELCPECFELAGYENALQDSETGHLDENDKVTVRAYLAELATHIGDRAYELHPELTAEVSQPAPEQPVATEEQPVEPATGGYLVAVSGNVNGEPYDNLILVDAPAARFARRYARSELREAGIDTTNLVFNARRA